MTGARRPSPGAAAAAIAVLAGVAAGCGNGSAADEPRTVLRFWAMGREGEVVQELVRDFEREQQGAVRVDVQQIPWSAAHEKLLTAFVGRSTPDVAQLGNTWIAEFEALGALAPFGEEGRDAYFPGIWDTNVIDGTPYGIPWYVDTRVLFYRSDVLARAGYERMPETWEAWRRAMEAVKREAGPDRFAIFLPTNEWTQPVILGLQAGSPLLAEDDTRGAFRGPEFRRALDFYLDLFRSGLAPPVANNEVGNLYQEFERGYFSMMITGPWNLGEFRRRLPEAMQDSWATAPLPGPDGPASGVSLAGGSSLVVFRETKAGDAARKLIEFLSRPEQQVRFYALTGDLPARREAWADPALASDPELVAFREQLERVVSTPKIPEWEQVAARLLERVEFAIRGAVSPDSVLADLDRDVDRMLEKRRWLRERHADGTATR